MQITLKVWRAQDSGFTRVYINGLTGIGKAWLQGSRGRTKVQFEAGGPTLDEDEVLALVMSSTGWNGELFDDLVSIVESTPAAPRGRSAASMASSRRGFEAARPPKWTPADASALDPNFRTNPLSTPVTIVVDDREPAEMVDILRRVENLTVEVASLETGDYLVPGVLMIERKTAADLVRSVVDESKRLFWQTDRVAASGLRGYLLLEGDLYSQTSMTLENISGTLTYLAAIQGIGILPTVSIHQSAYVIVKLIRHSIEGLGYDLGLRGSGPKDPKDPKGAAPFVLEGIPGVSTKSARALIDRFGSVAGVCAATVEELKSTDGIGPKRARLIYDTLRP